MTDSSQSLDGLAIIGGTGLTSLSTLEILRREMVPTPYGEPSGPLLHGRLCGQDVVFLARHGYGHTIPPHQVNYRANLWALRAVGVGRILAVAAVGAIRVDLQPGHLAAPDQIIDYSYGRDNTFFDRDLEHVTHIDFTRPYDPELRRLLLDAAANVGLPMADGGVYGVTQGPRLETAAEINRMERDGCDLVGMTGMPEAALARELGLAYATCAVIANQAAGRGPGAIRDSDIDRNLKEGMGRVAQLLRAVLSRLPNDLG